MSHESGPPPSLREAERTIRGSKTTECQPAAAAVFFFAICRLSSNAFGDSSESFALARKASSPPRWSTRLEGMGRDPQPHRAPERVRHQRDVQEVRQEPPLGLDIRMADLVAHLGTLAGQFTPPRHGDTLCSLAGVQQSGRKGRENAGSLEDRGRIGTALVRQAARSSTPAAASSPKCLDRAKMTRQTFLPGPEPPATCHASTPCPGTFRSGARATAAE